MINCHWFYILDSDGIGLLWVLPYIMTTHGHFYDDIRIPEENLP